MTCIRAFAAGSWWYLVIASDKAFFMHPEFRNAYFFDTPEEAAAYIKEIKDEPVIDLFDLELHTLEPEKIS